MRCVLCHRDERYQLNEKKVACLQEKEVSSFLCSNCVQRLLQMPQSEIIEAYNLAIEQGYSYKASWLDSFIDDETEEFYVSETRETGPNMVRERPLRQARLAHHQIRT